MEKIYDQENAEDLEQMSEDMKIHIAKLKAELYNPNTVSHDIPINILKKSMDFGIKNDSSSTENEDVLEGNQNQMSESEAFNNQLTDLDHVVSYSPANDLITSLQCKLDTNLLINNTPCSSVHPQEDSLPVKYLQMSSNLHTPLKKIKPLPHKSSSTPNSVREVDEDKPSLLPKNSSLQFLGDSLEAKYEHMRKKFFKLQMQCEILAEENIKMKKDERLKTSEKIASLKKSNAELAHIAKRLEEKAKSLQVQNIRKSEELSNLHREMQQHKLASNRNKVRWEAEQNRLLTQYNKRTDSLKSQLDDLKRVVRQSKREKLLQKGDGDIILDNNFAQNHKEMFRLQKLAAGASTKVVIRSLSTPTTARQKMLEETNRDLRKQVTNLENNIQKLEEISTMHENLLEEKKSLHEIIVDKEKTIVLLETELQQAKIEASDSNFQLNEIKLNYAQLEREYSTVHKQLEIAISERDQAVQKCIKSNSKLNEMQDVIKKLESNALATQDLYKKVEQENDKIKNLMASHDKISAQYLNTIKDLKSNVTELEGKLRDNDVENEDLKKQIGELVQANADKFANKITRDLLDGHKRLFATNSSEDAHSYYMISDEDKNAVETRRLVKSGSRRTVSFQKNEEKSISLFSPNFRIIPFPRELKLSEIPPCNLKIEWISPPLGVDDHVIGHEVLINGFVVGQSPPDTCCMIIEKPKNIIKQEFFTVAVSSVTEYGKSDPGHCLETIYKDCSLVHIVGLTCDYVSTNEAHLSWKPQSSASTYKISIGQIDHKLTSRSPQYDRQILVPRPMYEHTIDGLKPGIMYEMIVKSNNFLLEREISSDFFRLETPLSDPPEPPLNIQIEDDHENVIISWVPVALDEQGLSNGVEISGYQIFLNKRLLSSIPSSVSSHYKIKNKKFALQLSDHCQLNPNEVVYVSVRTTSCTGQLSQSSQLQLSTAFVQKLLSLICDKKVDERLSSCDNLNSSFSAVVTGDDSSKDNLNSASHTSILNSGTIEIKKGFPPNIEQIHIENVLESNLKSIKLKKRKQFSKSSCSFTETHSGSKESSSSHHDLYHLSDDEYFSKVNTHSFNKANKKKGGVEPSPGLHYDKNEVFTKEDQSFHHVSGLKSENFGKSRDGPISLFVALFDYNPNVMSPNSDCYEDELPFVEGQLLKVYGDEDSDGFLFGEDHCGRYGLIPSNMVAIVEVEDELMLDELFEKGHLLTNSPQSAASLDRNCTSTKNVEAPPEDDLVQQIYPTLYRALYDYDPREASPNIDSEIELTFSRGSLINIYGYVDEDGFFRGELGGQYGLVPSNFVERADPTNPHSVTSQSSSIPPLIQDQVKTYPFINTSATSNANSRSEKVKKKWMLDKGRKLLNRFGNSDKSKKNNFQS